MLLAMKVIKQAEERREGMRRWVRNRGRKLNARSQWDQQIVGLEY